MKQFCILLFITVTLSAQTERHFLNIKQITLGGSNAEAYFSADGKQLIYQATKDQFKCDQIFTMNIDGSNSKLVSTGEGRTTCAYFFPDGKKIIYASTHDDDDECPPRADRSKGYTWEVYNAYDIYIANSDGSNPKKLAASKGYDAEATISPDGKQIVFTSSRDGDLELYIMDMKTMTEDIVVSNGPLFNSIQLYGFIDYRQVEWGMIKIKRGARSARTAGCAVGDINGACYGGICGSPICVGCQSSG